MTLVQHGVWQLPLKIEQQESPDFVVKGAQDTVAVEVTEATHGSDQREYTALARPENSSRLMPFGALGGRQIGRSDLVVADAIEAIKRKSTHRYGLDRAVLVIYANSNPAGFLGEEEVDKIAAYDFRTGSFSEVWMLLSDWLLPLHHNSSTKLAVKASP